MCSDNPKDYWGFWKRLQRQNLSESTIELYQFYNCFLKQSEPHTGEFLQDLGKYLNPKYGLKIGDIYLAYLLFVDDIVLFSEFAEHLQAQIDLFYKYCENGIW